MTFPSIDADLAERGITARGSSREAIPRPATRARAWLKNSPASRIISLIKPHYELSNEEARALPRGGVLDPALAQDVVDRVLQRVHAYGVVALGLTRSPITGGGSKNNPAGNTEWLVLLGT